MKKIFTILILTLVAMMWSKVDARWVIGDRKSASQIKAGDTVVIEPASQAIYAGYYIQAADDAHKDYGVMVAEGMGIGDAAIITFVQGPNDIRTGAPTLLIKLVGSGQYIDNHWWDWGGGGFHATVNEENAAAFQLLSCGESVPWYDPNLGDDHVNWENADWVRKDDAAWDANSVVFSASPNEGDFGYVSFSSDTEGWGGGKHLLLSHWTHSCQFNVYAVNYIKGLREDLEELINAYTASELEYAGGTDPGYYDLEAIEAYDDALTQAIAVLTDMSKTDDEVSAATAELKSAREKMLNSSIPMSEGYYYIINDLEETLNYGVTAKAMYVDTDRNKIWYGPFDENDIKFVFKITPNNEETWLVQNLKTDLYFGPTEGYNSPFVPAVENTYYTKFNFYDGTGSCYIQTHNGQRLWGMSADGDPSSSDEANSFVYAYNGVEIKNAPHLKWTWRLKKITDQSVLDKFLNEKTQVDRTAELNQLVKEGYALYDNLFEYNVDTTNGLIKIADGGYDEEPSAESQISFSHIIYEGPAWADRYEFLIDGSDTTYMKGSGYIQVNISNTPQSMVAFFYARRGANVQYPNAGVWGEEERPAMVLIQAANDAEGDWTDITRLNMAGLTDPIIAPVNLHDTYKYLRYVVESNNKGGTLFTLGEFQVYTASIDEQNSQYHTTAGMKDKADALAELLKSSAGIVAANTATDTDITALRTAIAAVKGLYADTTELAQLIAESEVLLTGVQIGDGMGQLSDEALATALRNAIEEARETAFTTPVSPEAVKKATALVREAKAAFLAGLKSFETGKWYFITSLDTERAGDKGAEDAYCGGAAIYLNSKTPNASITKWGLLDNNHNLAADNNPKAMWRFVPVEGTEYYAIQNMYNGYYLGDFAGNNINLPVSEKPVPYDVAYVGNAKFNLIPKTRTNTDNLALWSEGYEEDIVCHMADDAAAWTFVELDPDMQEYIVLSDFDLNSIDIMAVPYDVKGIAEYNEDVQTYAVRKISQELDGDETVTTIEFYEKNEFKAGEPCLIVLGDTTKTTDFEDCDIAIPFPTEVIDHSNDLVSNGIAGSLHSAPAAPGTAVSNRKEFYAVGANGATFAAQTGIIDLSTYKQEIADEQTAYTLVIRGMAPLFKVGDVNRDGIVNSADVVAIYAYIVDPAASGLTLAEADVDGDGLVNSADVVAIYNEIVAGNIAGSPSFKAQMRKIER